MDLLEQNVALWAHNQSYIGIVDKAATTEKDASGNIANIDPETNKKQFSDKGELDGDHVLPKQAFKDAIADYEGRGGTVDPAMAKEIAGLMNGSENLRGMESGFNRSKQDSSAQEWSGTGKGAELAKTADGKAYLQDMAAIQENVGTKLDAILAKGGVGTNFVARDFFNQVI